MLIMSGRDGGSEEKFEFPRGSYFQLTVVLGIRLRGMTYFNFYNNLSLF